MCLHHSLPLILFYLIVPLRSLSCNIFWWDSSLTRDTSCRLPAASWLRCTNAVKSTINDSRWFLESLPLQRKGWHRCVRSLFTIYTAYVHVAVAYTQNILTQTGLYTCIHACSHIPWCVSSTIITSISVNLAHIQSPALFKDLQTQDWVMCFFQTPCLKLTVLSTILSPSYFHKAFSKHGGKSLFSGLLSSLLEMYQCHLIVSADIIDGVLILFKFPSFIWKKRKT